MRTSVLAATTLANARRQKSKQYRKYKEITVALSDGQSLEIDVTNADGKTAKVTVSL